MDLKDLATNPTKKAKKPAKDYQVLNGILEAVDANGIRVSYQTLQFLATQTGLMEPDKPLVAVFGHLDSLSKPWLVCTKKGTYHDTAKGKFIGRISDDDFVEVSNRPIVQIANAKALLESVTEK